MLEVGDVIIKMSKREELQLAARLWGNYHSNGSLKIHTNINMYILLIGDSLVNAQIPDLCMCF